ncbi:MAG TPA: YjbH domain-containing protein [Longimicrobium sp.]|nr:YjbH domain-containing protein [Longimicrobium sp.]
MTSALALVLALAARPVDAQSLTGTTGLVTIPTARMAEDRTLLVGAHLVDRRHHNSPYGDNAAVVEFATLGFLPFVEVGLRLTRVVDAPNQGLGDRMVSVRLRVLEEGAYRPAVVVGAHDLVGTRIYHSTYVVASKEVARVPVLGSVGAHLGHGGRWTSLKVEGRQFDGTFGGVSVAPRPWVTLLAEHDAERLNAGVRLRLLRRITLLGALHDLKDLSGGVGYTHPLR